MTPAPSQTALAALFISACEAELQALKPGNVHVHAGGHGMEVAHFEAAARAAAPFIAEAALGVGARVEAAVEASFAAAGLNTNLGIVLLCAPLAKAAETMRQPASGAGALRASLRDVLAHLDRDDAVHVFRAIARANPAGLGKVADADVSEPATVTLREAMALARDRDRIARAYVTDFEDIFSFGLPKLQGARSHGASESDAITTLHMAYLAAFPDSHIARKHGAAKAQEVCAHARELAGLWHPAAMPKSRPGLIAFDRELKAKNLNPGTTADLVVATLFTEGIIGSATA